MASDEEDTELRSQIGISAGGLPDNEGQKACFLVAGQDFGTYMTGQCAD